MKRVIGVFVVLCLSIGFAPFTLATNGDNLIGIGPISRAMGGVGIAAPQDAISAVFSNPAAMCVGPYCPSSEFNFAGTLFMPKVDAKITLARNPISAESDDKVYMIPALGNTPLHWSESLNPPSRLVSGWLIAPTSSSLRWTLNG